MASLVNVTPASQVATVEVTNRELNVTVQEAVKTVDITLETRGDINVEISRSIAMTGVQEIVAGTGISISPDPGTGVVTITATGDAGNAYHANIADVANSVAGANVTGFVSNATNATFAAVANSVAGANVSGTVANATNAQHAVVADSANSVAGANVVGVVANASHANTANIANSVAGANVTGTVASASQANTANIATVAYFVDGSNVSGYVANASHATVADSANLVAGANVQGYVAEATHALSSNVANSANSVAGSNVTGQVSYAAVANSVAVANVVGIGNIATVNLNGNGSQVLAGNGSWVATPNTASANYANFAGQVVDATQSNITSVGTLTDLTVSGNINTPTAVYADGIISPIAGNYVGIFDSTFANGLYVDDATIQLTKNANTWVFGGNGNLTLPSDVASINYANGSPYGINANYANYAGNAFSVTGSNVVGDVSGANHANIADVANSVAGANVTGTVGNATHATVSDSANSVSGSNVSGAVSLATYATTANAVAGANVSGLVANATHAIHSDEANSVAGANVVGYVSDADHATIANIANLAYSVSGSNVSGQVSSALTAGTVTASNQPNITSLGTLTTLSVADSIYATGNVSGAYILGDGSYLTGIGNLSAANGYWGSFYSNVSQTIASTTTAYAITLNNTDPDSHGVNITSNSRIHFTYAGTYNLQFSAQFLNTNNAIHEASIWLRKNGVDVPDSRGACAITDKQGGVNGQIIESWNYILKLNAGDYLELMWQAESTTISLEYLPAGTTPTTPASPSIIVTAQQVTNVQPVELQGAMTGNISGNSYGIYSLAELQVLGNVSGNIFSGNGSSLYGLAGANVVGDVSGANHANISDAANVAYSVSGANVSGYVANATHSNIADAANVAYSVSGANVTGAVAYATTANSVAGANVSGTVANATFATTAGSATSATTAGTVTTNAQPNITSVGTLTSLNSSGIITATRLVSNIATGTAPLTVSSTTPVANLRITGNQPNITGLSNSTVTIYNTSAVGGAARYLVITGSQDTDDTLRTVSGITAYAANNAISATTFIGNLTGSAGSATTAGTVTTNAQPNITSTGTLTGLTVSGLSTFTGEVLINNASGGGGSNEGGQLNLAAATANTTLSGPIAIDIYQNRLRFFETGGTNRGAYIDLSAASTGVGSNLLAGGGGGGTPGGSNTFVQFNDGGSFGGNSQFAYDKTTNTLTVGNITANGAGLSSITGSNVTGAVAYATTANSVAGANVSGYVANASHATVADSANGVSGANVSGTVASATIAQTVTTNAQPNITSVGLLTSLDVSGNIFSNTAVYVGNTSNATGLTNPTIVAKASGATYVQAAIVNGTPEGSADFVAYGDNGSDSGAWADMGFTGSNFSDPTYTITGINDGYFFVQGDDSSAHGGNLVIATGPQGSTKDIVFATGGFSASNEKMRFINADNQFYIQPTTAATDTITGALRVAGGVGIGGDVYAGNIVSANYFIGDGALLSNISPASANYANFAGEAFLVSGSNVSGDVAIAAYATEAGTASEAYHSNIADLANSVAGSNVSGEVSFAAVANSVAGANVSGEVANAAYATIAGTAYSVSAGNISGTVNLANYATVANSVAGANVSGAVSYATVANSVAVANVTGIGNIATTNYNGNGSQVLYGNGVFAAVSGGSGSPGGSNTQLQFNNSGSFGGISTVTWNGSNLSLGAVTTVKITGGSSGQVLSTDGTGNLSFVDQSGGGSTTDFTPSFLLGGM